MNLVKLEEMLPVMNEILDSGGEVSFTPNGNSMRPMLHFGRDEITIRKPSGRLKKYDLPLYQRENGKFILHRIIGENKDGYIARGDNQLEKEYGITDSQIIGVVTKFKRNGKSYSVNGFFYKLYVVLRCNGLTVLLRRIKGFIKRNAKRLIKTALAVLLGCAVLAAAALFGINTHIKRCTVDNIITVQQAAEFKDTDCILVLGCRVISEGNPSHMLEDRLKMGVELYDMQAAPKIIMSGDHGQISYDEVNTMKQYAIDNGVPSEDVFMDHAGFSTYESMYRAKEIFGAEKIIIVSQEYHLYRAVYIAESLGLQAYGVHSDYRQYAGQSGRELRELLARAKDFISCIIKPEPTYLGEAIPVSGNGNITNDR